MKTQIFVLFFALGVLLASNLQASVFDSAQKKIDVTENIKIYPNPIKDKANIEIKLEKETNIKIELFDLAGKKVKEVNKVNISNKSYTVSIDVSDFNEGIYFCRITTDQWIKAKRILIRK